MAGSASPVLDCPHHDPLVAYFQRLGFEPQQEDLAFLERLLIEACAELQGRELSPAEEFETLRARLKDYVDWRRVRDGEARREELTRRQDAVVGLIADFVSRFAYLGCPDRLLSDMVQRLLVSDPEKLRRTVPPDHLGQLLKFILKDRRRQTAKEKSRSEQLQIHLAPHGTRPRDPADIASDQEIIDLTFEFAQRFRPGGTMFLAQSLFDLSASEIGCAWGISESTAKRKISSFRDSLRVFLRSNHF